jgi:hypothetical protein
VVRCMGEVYIGEVYICKCVQRVLSACLHPACGVYTCCCRGYTLLGTTSTFRSFAEETAGGRIWWREVVVSVFLPFNTRCHRRGARGGLVR